VSNYSEKRGKSQGSIACMGKIAASGFIGAVHRWKWKMPRHRRVRMYFILRNEFRVWKVHRVMNLTNTKIIIYIYTYFCSYILMLTVLNVLLYVLSSVCMYNQSYKTDSAHECCVTNDGATRGSMNRLSPRTRGATRTQLKSLLTLLQVNSTLTDKLYQSIHIFTHTQVSIHNEN